MEGYEHEDSREAMAAFVAARLEYDLQSSRYKLIVAELNEQPIEKVRALYLSARDEQERRRRKRARELGMESTRQPL
jgi:hypothetical protein